MGFASNTMRTVASCNKKSGATTWCNKLILYSALLVCDIAYADSTYLRCYYRDDPSTFEVKEVWALNENNDEKFPVTGVWHSPSSIIANIFFTNISDKTLRGRCEDTLKRKGINAPLVMYAAADNLLSYNYLVWNVDPDSEATNSSKPEKIDRIVSFGDSLSDTNNFFNSVGWLNRPSKNTYYAGRFSNGKNWLDYLSEYLMLPVYNWAIGGAGTVDYNPLTREKGYWPNGSIIKIKGIRSQVDSWLIYMNAHVTDHEGVKLNQLYNPKNTLFTLVIGGNDVLQYETPVEEMIDQEEQALNSLINYGAKHILLSTLPDLSNAPLFLVRKLDEKEPKSDPKKVKQHIITFNHALKELAVRLKTTYGDKLNIHVFDAYALFNDLLNTSDVYGITDTKNSCLKITEETIDTYLNEGQLRSSCLESANKADSFIYWDLMHPTTHTHKIVADKVVCFIRNKFPIAITLSMEESLSDCEAD